MRIDAAAPGTLECGPPSLASTNAGWRWSIAWVLAVSHGTALPFYQPHIFPKKDLLDFERHGFERLKSCRGARKVVFWLGILSSKRMRFQLNRFASYDGVNLAEELEISYSFFFIFPILARNACTNQRKIRLQSYPIASRSPKADSPGYNMHVESESRALSIAWLFKCWAHSQERLPVEHANRRRGSLRVLVRRLSPRFWKVDVSLVMCDREDHTDHQQERILLPHNRQSSLPIAPAGPPKRTNQHRVLWRLQSSSWSPTVFSVQVLSLGKCSLSEMMVSNKIENCSYRVALYALAANVADRRPPVQELPNTESRIM